MANTVDGDLAVVILAAGQGTRMKSTTPKVLHRIGGRTLLGHVLVAAGALRPAEIVVVVRHERDRVADEVREHAPDARIVDQDETPGTGRAVELAVNAIEGFTGDVLVLSGDVPLLEPALMTGLVDTHRDGATVATLLSAVVPDPTGYGRVIRDDSGQIARIVEEKDATPAEAATQEINAGVYVFRAPELRGTLTQVGVANAQGEKYLTDVIGHARADGGSVGVAVAADAAVALGVNDRVQLAEAARLLNARTIQRWQREGVTVLDPATTWVDVTADLAPDVTLLPGTFVLGATSIATGATVGPDTSLVDCEVGEGATVRRADATLAVIGADATVGPFAYLRPGAQLHEGAKVGTFVEVKNSIVGEGSKVPHLSYIGDTTVGRKVNLGAGTITANYDDLTKHRTEIGDEVHSGSHNVFVAPVRIGDGAKTGAGAIVRKDVPPGALAMSVAPQRNIDGWVEKNRPGTGAAHAAIRSRSEQEAADGAQAEDG